MTDEPNEQTTLVPVREQPVDFYGDTLRAAPLADETIRVPLRPIVVALGLNWAGPRQRLNRDAVLAGEQGVYYKGSGCLTHPAERLGGQGRGVC